MVMKKITGWGIRGRPFSQSEFKRSHIKTAHKLSYTGYLSDIARFSKKRGAKAVLS